MSNPKLEYSANKDLKDRGINYYNGAILVVVVIFVIVCGLFSWRIFQERPHLNTIAIEVSSVNDSIDNSQLLSSYRVAIDSLNSLIIRQEDELTKNYNLFMKAREDDADMLKMVSIISAFLVALFTIIGVKSLKDLKLSIQEEVKSEAKRIAQETAKVNLKSEVNERLNESIPNGNLQRVIKENIISEINSKLGSIEDEMNELKERISEHKEDSTGLDDSEGSTESTESNRSSIEVPKMGAFPNIKQIDKD